MSSLIQLIIPSDSIFSPNTAQTSFGELIKSGKYDQVLDNALTWSIDFAANIVLALVLFLLVVLLY